MLSVTPVDCRVPTLELHPGCPASLSGGVAGGDHRFASLGLSFGLFTHFGNDPRTSRTGRIYKYPRSCKGTGSALYPASQMTWQEVRDRKVAQVNGQIPSEWRIEPELLARAPATAPVIDWPFEMGLITAEEKRLTELHITELAPMLARGEVSSVAVTRAYCHRAAIGISKRGGEC